MRLRNRHPMQIKPRLRGQLSLRHPGEGLGIHLNRRGGQPIIRPKLRDPLPNPKPRYRHMFLRLHHHLRILINHHRMLRRNAMQRPRRPCDGLPKIQLFGAKTSPARHVSTVRQHRVGAINRQKHHHPPGIFHRARRLASINSGTKEDIRPLRPLDRPTSILRDHQRP